MFASRPNIALCLLCLIVGGVALAAINSASLYTPDSTRYLIWAKSIASLDGYKDATHPNPSRYVVHAPLYPLLLAPVARLFPLDVVAAKIWTLCFGIALLLLLYVWLSRHAGTRAALAGSVLLALNPMFLVYSTEVLSDVPFAACMLLVMLSLERLAATDETKPWLLLTLSLAVSAGILLREVGFSLLFSVSAFLALRRRWKQLLLIALLPAAMYAIWYVRNEMIVAPFESTEITNARLFTHHFFTSPGDSLFAEVLARVVNNISVYGKGIGKLLFFPFHGFMQYDVVFVERFPLSLVYAVLDVAGLALVAFTAGVTLYGVIIDRRQSATAVFRLLFVCCYLMIVLAYPVNDVRFMLPLLLLMLFYCSLSFSRFVAAIPRRDRPSLLLRASPAILLVACALPNFVWDSQFIANSYSYKRSPLGFYGSTAGLRRYPSHFTMPLDLAGMWVAGHSDTCAVVLSQWKDLACWLGGRKIYAADQTIPLGEFESIIRDYGAGYLVSVQQKNGIQEFEVQMLQSRRYEFIPVETVADVRIYSVAKKRTPAPAADSSTMFRKGIALLCDERYGQAERLLDSVRRDDERNTLALFYSAVAKEFDMQLDEAKNRFAEFEKLPQSLIFLNEASVHKSIISRLELARRAGSHQQRAELLSSAGSECWNLGYRPRARSLLREALSADSSFSPGYVFGIHFAIAEGDTGEAKRYLTQARRAGIDHRMIDPWSHILSHLDTVRQLRTPSARSQRYLAVSHEYSELRIVESAIDNALLALTEDPVNLDAMMSLAHLYQSRKRYAPARTMLERAYAVEPQNAAIGKELQSVMAHF